MSIELLTFTQAAYSLGIHNISAWARQPAALALLVLLIVLQDLLRSGRNSEGADNTSSHKRFRTQSLRPPTASAADDPSTAEYAWSRGFGLLKYCGLRKGFHRTGGPPCYSLQPLDLPLPNMSDTEKRQLDELVLRLSDVPASRHRLDPGTLIRFLRARKGNLRFAEEYFRKAVAYREELGADTVLSGGWNLEAYERCLAPWWLTGGFLGHGLNGQAVAYERSGVAAFVQLLDEVPWEAVMRLDAVHILRSLAGLEEDAMQKRRPLGDAILVEDLTDFSWRNCNSRAVKAYAKIVAARDMLMPCSLGHILVVNAPRAFSAAWAMVKVLLEPAVVEKVQIASSRQSSLKLMRRYIADDQIPVFLGGSRIVDGDPECRTVLAPGGPIPREAITRFLDLIAGDLDGHASGVGDESFEANGAAEHNGREEVVCGACPKRACATW